MGFGMITGTVKPKEVVRTVCTNPVLIAVVIGLVIYLCQIPVPEVIEQPLALIGNMNTPLSMIITGMMIAGSNLAQMLCDRRILSVVGIRMLLIPLCASRCFLHAVFPGWLQVWCCCWRHARARRSPPSLRCSIRMMKNLRRAVWSLPPCSAL